jgi:hypothetical protein
MEDLLIVIVAGVEVIFAGSEMLLTFMSDTEIFGVTLYGWFLGYLVLNTIITTFIPNDTFKTLNNNMDTVDDTVDTPDEEEINYELD